MKKFLMSFVLLVGCSSPAVDYVNADKAAWDQFDAPLPSGKVAIDAWIDAEPSFSADKKDALHQLNTGRRARIAHAIAAVGS